MDLRQLESFVAIAKRGSFTRAAEELYLSQPTLSGHIQSLESELETVLFNRSVKGVTLTEAGRILYIHALNILNTRDQAFFAMDRYKGRIIGELTIAASTVPQKCILPALLAAFNKKYPAIEFQIKHFDSKGVIDAITSGNLDFGFVGSQTDYKDLAMMKVCEDSLLLIAPNRGKYARIKKDSLAWEEIASERFIVREEGSATKDLFFKGLHKMGIDTQNLNIVAVIEDSNTIIECVREGLGLAVISELMVGEAIKAGQVRGFYLSRLEMERQFYFIHHKKRALNPLDRAFQEFTAEYFAS